MNDHMLRCFSESKEKFFFSIYSPENFHSFLYSDYNDKIEAQDDFRFYDSRDDIEYVVMYNSQDKVSAIATVKNISEWNSIEIIDIKEYEENGGIRLFEELTSRNSKFIHVYLVSCAEKFVIGKRFHKIVSDNGKTYFYKNQALGKDDLQQFLDEQTI